MKTISIHFLLAVLLVNSCGSPKSSEPEYLGKFDKTSDLYLAQFDSKTDVDDIHSIAAVATMLADPRFQGVSYHAVAGAYGTQGGLYVPSNDLFEMAFGSAWSDAHTDFEKALTEVSALALEAIENGGKIWIAEGGQSDFSAALVREIHKQQPGVDLKSSVNIVQHADWNEEVTTPEDLAYVKEVTSYHKIPDGNSSGNGTPDFRDDQAIEWRPYIKDPHLTSIWERAIEIGDRYNGSEQRYLNESIKAGGLDFSDVAETMWIFGFSDLVDADDFFQQFAAGK